MSGQHSFIYLSSKAKHKSELVNQWSQESSQVNTSKLGIGHVGCDYPLTSQELSCSAHRINSKQTEINDNGSLTFHLLCPNIFCNTCHQVSDIPMLVFRWQSEMPQRIGSKYQSHEQLIWCSLFFLKNVFGNFSQGIIYSWCWVSEEMVNKIYLPQFRVPMHFSCGKGVGEFSN